MEEVGKRVKPRLRGVSHEIAFFVSFATGALLIVLASAHGTKATIAACIYAFAMTALFGSSALYHVPNWSASVRRWLRRLDHSSIFLLIAGTFTPFTTSPQFDPPSIYGTTGIPGSYSPNRYYFSSTKSLARCRHMQIKISFGRTSIGDELFNLTIFGRLMEEF